MTEEPFRAMGMSAAERNVRDRLWAVDKLPDHINLETPIGVLRTLMRDLDMWREISTNDIDKWSFAALVVMAKRLLDTVYPEDIFVPAGVSAECDVERDSGVRFVVMLRELIKEVEKNAKPAPGDPVTAADAEYAAAYHAEPRVETYDTFADDGRTRMVAVPSSDIVRGNIELLPDDKDQGIALLNAALRMVVRFKR